MKQKQHDTKKYLLKQRELENVSDARDLRVTFPIAFVYVITLSRALVKHGGFRGSKREFVQS